MTGRVKTECDDFARLRRCSQHVRALDDELLRRGTWRDDSMEALCSNGAVLLRGEIADGSAVEHALGTLSHELLDDAFWSTPRSKVQGKTLTATEYPSPRAVQLHSEMAYMQVWPRLIAFHALDVAEEGGQTTICDLDVLSEDLGDLLAPFAAKGVTYRRTFQKGIDIPRQQAFQTDRCADVEQVARRFDMNIEWLSHDELATSHRAQGTITAENGQQLYFRAHSIQSGS